MFWCIYLQGFFPSALAKKKKKWDQLSIPFYCFLNSLKFYRTHFFLSLNIALQYHFKDYVVLHDTDKLLAVQQMPVMRHQLFPTFRIRNNYVLITTAEEYFAYQWLVFLGFTPRNEIATSRGMNQIWGNIAQGHLPEGLYILCKFIPIYILWRWACIFPTSRTRVGITILKNLFSLLNY